MATNKQKIDPIDEALRLWMLSDNSERDETVDASEQINHITSVHYKSEPSLEKATELVNRLYSNLAIDSLGILLDEAICKSTLSISEIATKANLPEESIEQLKADSIFTNSIPVISLRDLLKELQIPFEKAQQAIIKSFHLLKSNLAFSTSSINTSLAYRRKNSKTSSNTKSGKSDSQYLFENEEALTKYLKRLSELY